MPTSWTMSHTWFPIHKSSKQKLGPTARLLTTAPVQALSDEMSTLVLSRHHIQTLYDTIYHILGKDRQADPLRRLLVPFNGVMFYFVDQTRHIIRDAKEFYSTIFGDYYGDLDVAPKEGLSRIFDSHFQTAKFQRAKQVIKRCETSRRLVIDKAAPLIQELTDELNRFVTNYGSGWKIMDEYVDTEQLEAVVYIIHVDHPNTPVPEIENLLSDFQGLQRFLKDCLSFLDHIQFHFQRICEVVERGIETVGYSTSSFDLQKLYKDRLRCSRELFEMELDWFKVRDAFTICFIDKGGSSRWEKLCRYREMPL